ncbi:MAG: tetratricopeptide repeat protein [Rhodospirillales bacterium]
MTESGSPTATPSKGDEWDLGSPTPQAVIDELGFDPATLPDAPPEPTPEQQAVLDEAEAAYGARDFKTAHDLWLPLAEAGVAEAQYRIGRLYRKGNGKTQSDDLAFNWYSKAASFGHINSLFNISYFLSLDNFYKKNYIASAIILYYLAKKGDDDAKINLGLLLMTGRGVPQNPITAYKWFYLAGSSGYEVRQRFMMFTTVEQRIAGRKAADYPTNSD